MGMNVMQNLLQAHPDIDGVYATNDEMALGALRAVQTAGIKKDIAIIGFDGTPDALKSIRDGGLTATIKQDSYMIGYYGVEYAVKYLNGEEVEKEIPVPTLVIDKTNVQEEIANMEKILGRQL
jgi:ribose transport system substrate-binding protein